MSRRIFRIIIAIAIVIWITLFVTKNSISKRVLLSVASLTFLAFSLGIHGLIAHSIRPPRTKEKLITFPLLMWVLWAVMFLIIPVYCPDLLMAIW